MNRRFNQGGVQQAVLQGGRQDAQVGLDMPQGALQRLFRVVPDIVKNRILVIWKTIQGKSRGGLRVHIQDAGLESILGSSGCQRDGARGFPDAPFEIGMGDHPKIVVYTLPQEKLTYRFRSND